MAKSSFADMMDKTLDKAEAERRAGIAGPVIAPAGAIGMRTAGGMHMEVAALREKVKKLEESAGEGEWLDPSELKVSKLANRSEHAFLTEDFKRLKDEIKRTNGNVQAVGYSLQSDGSKLLVFGHRRRRACADLATKVRSIKVADNISDELLMLFMHAENKERADLSVYEQGMWYHSALEDGVYKTIEDMALALGVSNTWIIKALRVARLPEDVIKCFVSPLEITSKMGEDLEKALKQDQDAVLIRALDLLEKTEPMPAAQVFLNLMFEGGETRAEKPRPLSLGDRAKPYAKINRDAKGRIQLQLAPDFNRTEMKRLEAFIADMAKEKAAFQVPVKKSKKAAAAKPAEGEQ